MTIGFSFRYPTDELEHWTDEAIKSLVGQQARISVLGEPSGMGEITEARRYEDPMLGPGIWITMEKIDEPTD